MLSILNPQDFEWTLEPEFLPVRYTELVNETSLEDLRVTLLEIVRQLMIRENMIRSLVKATN